MSLLYRVANFPQSWGDKYNLFTILALFILILAANAIVIQEYVRDPNFDQIPESMYTGLKAILGIVIGIALIVVYRMGRQFVSSEGTRSKAWNVVKVLLFLGLIVWAVVPELILLYSRRGCDALHLEKAVYINAIVGITVSSLVILWVMASFFVKNPDAGRLQASAECQKAVKDAFIPFYNGVVQDDKGTYYCFLSDPTVSQDEASITDIFFNVTEEAKGKRLINPAYKKAKYDAKKKKVSKVKECLTQTIGQLCGYPLNETEARALEAKNKEMCSNLPSKYKASYSNVKIDEGGYVYVQEDNKQYCVGKTKNNSYFSLDEGKWYEEVGNYNPVTKETAFALRPVAPDVAKVVPLTKQNENIEKDQELLKFYKDKYGSEAGYTIEKKLPDLPDFT